MAIPNIFPHSSTLYVIEVSLEGESKKLNNMTTCMRSNLDGIKDTFELAARRINMGFVTEYLCLPCSTRDISTSVQVIIEATGLQTHQTVVIYLNYLLLDFRICSCG